MTTLKIKIIKKLFIFNESDLINVIENIIEPK